MSHVTRVALKPHFVIPEKQGVSKLHPREATPPEIVIPAKAGIQEGLGGAWCLC